MLFQSIDISLCHFYDNFHWCVTQRHPLIDISPRYMLHMFPRLLSFNPAKRKVHKIPNDNKIRPRGCRKKPIIAILGAGSHLGCHQLFCKMLQDEINVPDRFCLYDVLAYYVQKSGQSCSRGCLTESWQLVIIMSHSLNLGVAYMMQFTEN